MKSDQPIRMAIIGVGRNLMGMHAPCLIKHPRFTITAVCDTDPDALRAGRSYFDCLGYVTADAMLAAGNFDFVLVMVRSNDHCHIALKSLEAGYHTLVTKPWGINADEIGRMIETADRVKRRILFWAPVRWAADLEFLKNEKAVIGELQIIRRMHTTCSLRDDWQIWKRYGGGYLLNWGPHLLDQVMVLADSPVKSVNADLRQFWNPGDTEDAFKATLEFENGILAEVELTQSPIAFPNWMLQGKSGAICVRDAREAEVRKLKAPSAEREDEYRQNFEIETSRHSIKGDPYGDAKDVYDAIADELNGSSAYRMDSAQALEVAIVLDAIRESAENGLKVTL
ncbi:Gfo/Idh/MocA family protein [Cerasicoccus maritimus]|uniref:Gfo/Idh/MocA family protein n=1 Tax=Cerasicoccus maritimus TaxID=490089 RepID=UPI002852CE76|nr:Gfo/Idh/MocA family oxidoreductase [Cerasicoccus maritimus]